MTKNIMIVGVGGQGSLLASKLLGRLLMNQGNDVKVSEVHGMSQRGGSVVTYVKFGDKVYSPIIDKGEADIILAFEMLEAYRALPYLKVSGRDEPQTILMECCMRTARSAHRQPLWYWYFSRSGMVPAVCHPYPEQYSRASWH